MKDSALDSTALLVAISAAAVIATSLIVADRGNHHRRAWKVAGLVTLGLSLLAGLDLLRESPRETHVSGIVFGIAVAVLGSLGMVRGTRRVRPWLRGPLVAVTTLVLLLSGILLGAAYVSHLLPF